jgi:coenzyme PQQ synthesis protein D (PqqD)
MITEVSSLSPEAVVTRAGDPLAAPVDGDLVMLDPRRGVYYGLNPIGARIWQLIEAPRSVEGLCSALQEEFDVPPEKCRADVVAFLEHLQRQELVEIR